MAKAQVKEIKYHKIVNLLSKDEWRCHVYTSDGKHYSGEGPTQEAAKNNALDVMHAND